MVTSWVTEELGLQIVETRLDKTFHLLFLTLFTLLLQINPGNPELDLDWGETEWSSLIEAANGVLGHIDGLI